MSLSFLCKNEKTALTKKSVHKCGGLALFLVPPENIPDCFQAVRQWYLLFYCMCAVFIAFVACDILHLSQTSHVILHLSYPPHGTNEISHFSHRYRTDPPNNNNDGVALWSGLAPRVRWQDNRSLPPDRRRPQLRRGTSWPRHRPTSRGSGAE